MREGAIQPDLSLPKVCLERTFISLFFWDVEGWSWVPAYILTSEAAVWLQTAHSAAMHQQQAWLPQTHDKSPFQDLIKTLKAWKAATWASWFISYLLNGTCSNTATPIQLCSTTDTPTKRPRSCSWALTSSSRWCGELRQLGTEQVNNLSCFTCLLGSINLTGSATASCLRLELNYNPTGLSTTGNMTPIHMDRSLTVSREPRG